MNGNGKKYFPVFIDISDKKIVVVGAGTIAKRRIRTLLDFTPRLTVIAPEVNPELRGLEEEGKLEIVRAPYNRAQLEGAFFVIAAAGDNRLNQEIYGDCKTLGIPVNVSSDKTRCDFYFPVLAYDGTVVAGVNSGGCDPARTRRTAERIRQMLAEETAQAPERRKDQDAAPDGKPAEAADGRSCAAEKAAEGAAGGPDREPAEQKGRNRAEEKAAEGAAGGPDREPAEQKGRNRAEENNADMQPGGVRTGQRMRVRIYTDGAARGNPNGPGGYGVVLQYTDRNGVTHERELSQGYIRTTNNRMELMAAIIGLEALTKPCEVDLYSDSQYLINAFNQRWVDGWVRKNWMRTKTELVKNPDLWKRLLAAARPHQVTWHWVKGHAGHPENERCDRLAAAAADGDSLIADEQSDAP